MNSSVIHTATTSATTSVSDDIDPSLESETALQAMYRSMGTGVKASSYKTRPATDIDDEELGREDYGDMTPADLEEGPDTYVYQDGDPLQLIAPKMDEATARA
jgi:hypothetical protein